MHYGSIEHIHIIKDFELINYSRLKDKAIYLHYVMDWAV